MNSGKVFDVVLAIVWVAAIFVLVRPGSQGPGFVQALSNGLTSALGAATGGGKWGDK